MQIWEEWKNRPNISFIKSSLMLNNIALWNGMTLDIEKNILLLKINFVKYFYYNKANKSTSYKRVITNRSN